MQEVNLEYSAFRQDIREALASQLGYLITQHEDGDEALEEADGAIAQVFDKWLKKAYIDGHAAGVRAAIADHGINAEFSPIEDAIYAERKYLGWKR
jgi:hypothetical protein